MYRIKPPTQKVLDDFYNDYNQCILDGVNFFLSGKTVGLELNDSNQTKLDVGINAGSPSESFLLKLKDPALLKFLMTCHPNNLPDIINYVFGLFHPKAKVLAKKKLTTPVYRRFYLGSVRVDHFYTIMHKIFVEWVFDAKINNVGVFDKLRFNQGVDLKICPYCGAEDISIRSAYRNNTVVHAKPDVDHFLPKSKYPYLAMSYANLIPCSEPCNRQMKRTLNPLVSLNPTRYSLMNPYLFDASAVVFSYDYDNTSYFNESAYNVKVDYPVDSIMQEGYSKGLGIDSLYGRKQRIIVNLYKQMSGWDTIYQRMLVSMGINPSKAQKTQKPDFRYLFGYDCDEESSMVEPYYKFKYDIAVQMMNDGGCRWPW